MYFESPVLEISIGLHVLNDLMSEHLYYLRTIDIINKAAIYADCFCNDFAVIVHDILDIRSIVSYTSCK